MALTLPLRHRSAFAEAELRAEAVMPRHTMASVAKWTRPPAPANADRGEQLRQGTPCEQPCAIRAHHERNGVRRNRCFCLR
jgi:hypothetical protein